MELALLAVQRDGYKSEKEGAITGGPGDRNKLHQPASDWEFA
jgi:hypothetical protein